MTDRKIRVESNQQGDNRISPVYFQRDIKKVSNIHNHLADILKQNTRKAAIYNL